MGIHRTCMRDHIRNAIVSRILDGSTPAGTRLKEMTLAREFNVSQAPVREALRELEAVGLLESERYRGTRVRNIDMDELREAYELRAAIEESAARLAVPCAKADLDKLEGDLKLIHRAHREHDSDAFMDGAVNFHRHIVQMSGNKLYLRAWENMAWDIRARIAVQRIGLIGVFAEERRAIIAALRSGDGEKAGQLLRQILGELLTRLASMQQAAWVDTGDLAQAGA
ncbi:GntR family transcriptional regulator [Nevskia soli]|uniref:GntR family transcriptional regulator n=1 Tax=Nevskia soli TaxID=418856 RepID=UPI00069073BB|nr:GntR family transcriptional regulator [Nevskia soli]